jgi:hypothetical protein
MQTLCGRPIPKRTSRPQFTFRRGHCGETNAYRACVQVPTVGYFIFLLPRPAFGN